MRVLLADDHPVVRGGLRGLIDAQSDMEVVGEACDGQDAVRFAIDLRPDVVVMDVSMPGFSGAEATERIRDECPHVRVLALTAHEDRGYLQLLLKAGAAGYALKRVAAEELVRAVRSVAAGKTYIDPAVAGQLIAGTTRRAGSDQVGTQAELSNREREVLRFTAQGYAVKHIAARLNVGIRTVETYKTRAMEKLGLKTRADIVRYAQQSGWLSTA